MSAICNFAPCLCVVPSSSVWCCLYLSEPLDYLPFKYLFEGDVLQDHEWVNFVDTVPKHQEKTFSLMGTSRGWTSQASAHLPPRFLEKNFNLKKKYIYTKYQYQQLKLLFENVFIYSEFSSEISKNSIKAWNVSLLIYFLPISLLEKNPAIKKYKI
jgi:hypothetical protein